jgi:glutamate/aspartate transport system substrate-binding protein
MLRKGDVGFKKLADGAISAGLKADGMALYKKWFESPVPPNNYVLNLPLSDDMKDLFKNPNDKAFQ